MPTSFSQAIGRKIPLVEVMDIGAMAEGVEAHAGLLADGEARVTGFEPNPEQYALLKDRPGPYRYLPYFLGNGGRARFHLTRYAGCSSLIEPDPSVIDLFQSIGAGHPGGNFHVERTIEVDTVRLDDLPAEIVADHLKIDVQGYELEVLKNGVERLAATLVIQAEVEFLALYRDQPLFGDIQVFLRDRGFVFHKFVDVVGRAIKPFRIGDVFRPHSQMLWADAVFVRDYTRLDRWSDDDLLKGAAICDRVIASHDLALHLLLEWDRRNAGSTAAAYVETLRRTGAEPLYLNTKAPN